MERDDATFAPKRPLAQVTIAEIACILQRLTDGRGGREEGEAWFERCRIEDHG